MSSQFDQLAESWAFLSSSPNGIMILDEDSHILFVNRAMEVLTGHSSAKLVKMNVRDIIPPDVPNPHQEKLSKIIKNRSGPREMKPLSAVPLLRKNGSIVRVNVERRVYRYGDVRRFAGIVTPA